MANEFVVTSIEQYLALPELSMPAVPNEKAAGKNYRVHKAGFYAATEEECRRHDLDADLTPEAGKYLLPTIVVSDDGGQKSFHRLPFSLAPWVIDAVALAHAGANPFPGTVEFGILKDRHYAQIA